LHYTYSYVYCYVIDTRKGEVGHLAYVRGDEVADELFHVVVNGSSFLDGGDDSREVVVSEHHL